MPRYNIFAEIANRVKINQQAFFEENTRHKKEFEETKK